MNMKGRVCELCNQQASLYCPSDAAFLCWNCDATVHRANFLVARHLRHPLCSKCDSFAGIHVTGAAPRTLPSTCRSCSPENPSDDHADSLPSSSSSSESCTIAPKKTKAKCTTTTGRMMRSCSSSMIDDASPAAKRRRMHAGSVAVAEAEEVFVKWSRELGLGLGGNGYRVASQALMECLGTWKFLPFKVAAATSFWLGLRFCGDDACLCVATFQNLLRLEAISGVPAKLILAAHAKLARVFSHRLELQEGWDES